MGAGGGIGAGLPFAEFEFIAGGGIGMVGEGTAWAVPPEGGGGIGRGGGGGTRGVDGVGGRCASVIDHRSTKDFK